MSDYALINIGTVDNVALAGDPPDASWLAAVEAQYDAVVNVTSTSPRPGIGWTYSGGTFTPPPEPPPEP